MIKKPTQAAIGTAFALLLIFSNASGITVNLDAAKDNTLYEDETGTLSNGAGPGFFAGMTGASKMTRGLIMFDVAAEIPSAATITSASLTLNVSKAANPLAEAIRLQRAASDWGEADSIADGGSGGGGAGGAAQPGDATWTHSFSPDNAWANFGGDFSETVSASQSVSSPGSYTWSDAQLTSDIQEMLDTPGANFGWIVLGNEAFAQTAKRFDSRESFNPPILTIEFDLGGGFDFNSDFDGDNDVDADDLGDWQDAFGAGNGGDADNDNDSDGADFLIWQQEFSGPAGLQTAVVPEPSAAALVLAWLALGALNRRSNALGSEFSRK